MRLDFADPWSTGAGQRQFNVGINGTQVLTNFDIVAAAGGPDKAVAEMFTATADANGQITVEFQLRGGGLSLGQRHRGALRDARWCRRSTAGELAGGTITINPKPSPTRARWQASQRRDMNVNGAWTNSSTITATNSTLNLGDQYRSSTNVWSNTGTIRRPTPR